MKIFLRLTATAALICLSVGVLIGVAYDPDPPSALADVSPEIVWAGGFIVAAGFISIFVTTLVAFGVGIQEEGDL